MVKQSSLKVWELDKHCDCDWCKRKGNRNLHAWAFYYFLKKCGDFPRLKITEDKIVIEVRDDT